MNQIRKAFITNCVLMSICGVLLAYTIATFKINYDLLHAEDASTLLVIFLLPLFFGASLATLIMGAVQVSIAIRNIVKVRKWYTILLLVISCLIVVAPIVMVSLIFLL